MECHMENDFLLIWFDKETDTIKQVRLGSHSELFKKWFYIFKGLGLACLS